MLRLLFRVLLLISELSLSVSSDDDDQQPGYAIVAVVGLRAADGVRLRRPRMLMKILLCRHHDYYYRLP